MKALALRTRLKNDDRDGDACLLVYDSGDLTSATISADVRDILIYRPNTPWIYVLCPFVPIAEARSILFDDDGFAPKRAGHLISLLHLQKDGETWSVQHSVRQEQPHKIAPELVHGWLFDLFDSRGGLVKAPAGVHFTKLSGQHTDRFLRAGNVLLTSSALGAVAFFTQALIGATYVRRVYVDTAPLIGLAFAMTRVARAAGMTVSDPEVESFSSYGGLGNLPPPGANDLFLLSASTSGSLAKELIKVGASERMILTLFLLGPSPKEPAVGQVVANLTVTTDRHFGYAPVTNATAEHCAFCKRGYVKAPLEGDQFLLQKRDAVRLRVSQLSQPKQAREAMELLARHRLWSIDRFGQSHRTNIRLDTAAALAKNAPLAEPTIRMLRRFIPSPLTAIVLVDLEEGLFRSLIARAGLRRLIGKAKIYKFDELASMPSAHGSQVLVMIGVLDDHAKLRGVNAEMRLKAPQGNVAYLSALTIVDSAQTLYELSMFLCYGERGGETFTFRSAQTLMLPNPDGNPSAWSRELELLQRMSSELEDRLAPELRIRLELLNQESGTSNLFLAGKTKPLSIAADFVYLDTKDRQMKISQADIFVVVTNLLATARCDNVGLATLQGKQPGAVVKSQSVYGQVLINLATLCPRNLRDYNDSVLRAAMLRAAHVQELNYSVDEVCSAEVLSVLLAEVGAWSAGNGDASPETLMAMACGRLRLCEEHMARFVRHARQSIPDAWAQQLLDQIGLEAANTRNS